MQATWSRNGDITTMVKLKRTKDEIVKKADELAIEYEAKHKGCAQCTFLAIVDALRWGGLEIIPKDMEDRFFSGICVLTAGVGLTGEGTCGAVASSALTIGLALGIQREGQDVEVLGAACATVSDTIVDKYYREYRSILCKDVQRRFFGKAWDLTNKEMDKEFRGLTRGCTIMQTAKWTVAIILDEFEKGNVKGYVGSPEAKA
jgi:hypothetical protein